MIRSIILFGMKNEKRPNQQKLIMEKITKSKLLKAEHDRF